MLHYAALSAADDVILSSSPNALHWGHYISLNYDFILVSFLGRLHGDYQ